MWLVSQALIVATVAILWYFATSWYLLHRTLCLLQHPSLFVPKASPKTPAYHHCFHSLSTPEPLSHALADNSFTGQVHCNMASLPSHCEELIQHCAPIFHRAHCVSLPNIHLLLRWLHIDVGFQAYLRSTAASDSAEKAMAMNFRQRTIILISIHFL